MQSPAQGFEDVSTPPVAARRQHKVMVGNVGDGQLRGHDDTRLIDPPVAFEDDLFWLRDDARDNAEVLGVMKAEQAYTRAATARLVEAGGPVDRLFVEMRSRLKETDSGMPYSEGPFLRYERTVAGKAYRLHCRVVASKGPDAVNAASHLFSALQANTSSESSIHGEEILLDENELAAEQIVKQDNTMADDGITNESKAATGGQIEVDAGGVTTCDVNTVKVSPDGSLLAYSVDITGTEVFDIFFKRLAWRIDDKRSASPVVNGAGNVLLPDRLAGTNGTFVFGASDSSSVFYLTLDALQRPDRLWCHTLGAPQCADVCLFHERDDRFWCSLSRSLSGDFVFFRTTSKTSSEVWAIPLTDRAVAVSCEGGAKQVVPVAGAFIGMPREEVVGMEQKKLEDPPALLYMFVIHPRSEDVLYSIDHYVSQATESPEGQPSGKRQRGPKPLDVFAILTNKDSATNFKICVARVRHPRRWVELLSHSSTRHLEDVQIFGNFWQLTGREEGYQQLFVWLRADVEVACEATLAGEPAPAASLERLPARDAVFFFEQSVNLEYNADALRFVYSSPTCPPMTCEYRPGPRDALPAWATAENGAATTGGDATILILKRKEVPNVDLSAYVTARLFAHTKDGRAVPISILYRPSVHEMKPNSKTVEDSPFVSPSSLLLYGYGAYGISWDPEFSASSLSLCDRGVVFAIAHIRGGAELGRIWYDEGKMLHKHNTFSDYIACAEHLVTYGWTANGRIIAEGGSAGGLLIGVVANTRPDLWAGCILQCPFLDAVVTMCDSSIPLVSTEWNEWGNPNVAEELEAIRAYDPMLNIKAQAYPPLLIEAGLNDTRVGYWEPLKFAQRVRALTTGNARHVMMKVEMDEGHIGAMDRYKDLRDRAFEIAWALQCLGKDA